MVATGFSLRMRFIIKETLQAKACAYRGLDDYGLLVCKKYQDPGFIE